MCEDFAEAKRLTSVGVSSNINAFLLKFKVPISIFYCWHSDKRPKQVAFVTIRVDCCNNLLCGLLKYQLSRSVFEMLVLA